GKKYGGRLDDMTDVGFRVVADHLRMAVFSLADGARPGNKKRDAVVRSVIRRAVRFGYQCFDQREPFLFKLVPVLVNHFGGAFPELKANPQLVADILRDEERDFYKAIARGMKYYRRIADKATHGKKIIDGVAAADLQTTYGFPFDLTKQMALEDGVTVDEDGYRKAIDAHVQVSGQDRKRIHVTAVQGDLPATDDSPKYYGLTTTA